MRFCMITTFYPPANFGGDGIFVQSLARALAARGHEVTVIHCADSYRTNAGVHAPHAPHARSEPGIEIIRLQSPFGRLSPTLTQQSGYPLLKRSTLRAVLQRRFDVVNYHNISLVGGPGILSMPAADAIKIYTLHDHWLLCSTHVFWKNKQHRCDTQSCLTCCVRSGVPPQAWRLGTFRDRCLAQVDAILAPSHFTANLHRQHHITGEMEVLPLFSRLKVAENSATASFGLPTPSAPARFIYVGRLIMAKGIAELVADVAASSHHLDVIGDGELLAPLRARYADCKRIRFLGRLDDDALVNAYRAARAIIMPSLAPESFGLSVVEAMAFGVPAIVRDSGGCAEIVRSSAVGFVYTTRAQLHDYMDALASAEVPDRQLAARARDRYAAHYSEERYIKAYFALVERLRAARSMRVIA